jgi:predicted anti-sigma-YlaC factor YlaD
MTTRSINESGFGRRWARGGSVVFALGMGVCLFAGCSVKKMAVNKLGNALAESGTTFASDDDPELVKAAVPFALKLMESLLAESPKHQGLLFASSSGFTQYAYAFVQLEADELEERDHAAAQAMRERARRLYLRARDYGLRGLEARHRGFGEELRVNPRRALSRTRKADVPQLYWTAASWAGAISILKDDPDLIADLPLVEGLMDRALALEPDFDHGAIHTFLISYESSRQGAEAGAEARARAHFARAMELGNGQQAGPLVALAEVVSVQKQDVAEFRSLLKQALAVDADARPEWRLVNRVMQRRAAWLLARTDELFLLPPGD